MPEIGASGLMSGDGKRGDGQRTPSYRAHPRLYICDIGPDQFGNQAAWRSLSHAGLAFLSDDWALPWDTAPRYLLRDRAKSYGLAFRDRVRATGFEEVVAAPRSPCQNPYVERLIGSIRRECLDHVTILNERNLRRVLSAIQSS
jgi:hypothetical protein